MTLFLFIYRFHLWKFLRSVTVIIIYNKYIQILYYFQESKTSQFSSNFEFVCAYEGHFLFIYLFILSPKVSGESLNILFKVLHKGQRTTDLHKKKLFSFNLKLITWTLSNINYIHAYKAHTYIIIKIYRNNINSCFKS